MIRRIVPLACALFALPALAHKPSDAYVTIERQGTALRGRWDIALRDLDNALGLDADGSGDITWGEVRRRQADIAAYALPRLQASSSGERCALNATALSVDTHTDGAYAVITLAGECPKPGRTVSFDYRLFEGLDPQHRGLLNFIEGDQSRSLVFSADAPHQVVGGDTGGGLRQFAAYLREGVFHIWTGFDHILFLLSLLLPAVLVRSGKVWGSATGFRTALAEVARIVTAFTIAHSITLTLATLSIVMLPSRLVESGIALSVLLAALNNLFPFVERGRSAAAFGFGLLHGFGFAGALQDLGLPAASLTLSLAGFNLGVETGQLVIVMLFLPVAFAIRSTWTYRRLILGGGSAAIAATASVWLAQRAFDVTLFSAFASR